MLGALALLILLAALSPWLTALPAVLALPLTSAALLAGAGRWRRLARQPVRRLRIPRGPGPACVDGLPVAALRVQWRGPLARMTWRRGPGRSTSQALLFWPDTLPPALRRELRLALRSRAVSSSTPAMAP